MTDVPAAPDWRIIGEGTYCKLPSDLNKRIESCILPPTDPEYEPFPKVMFPGNVWASDSLGLTVVLPQGEVPPKSPTGVGVGEGTGVTVS